MSKVALYKKLAEIQKELKAPKNQYNSFGKYKYRSCEDILEAVKPLAVSKGAVVVCQDAIENVNGRFYVKATVFLYDTENDCEPISTSAYAREEDSKKGMDGSQVTGASSSYARKYALNAMFCIDDTKDSDATNQTTKNSISNVLANQAPKAPSKSIVAFDKFKKLPCNEGMNIEELRTSFAKLFSSVTNKSDGKTLTDAEWDLVIKNIEEAGDLPL